MLRRVIRLALVAVLSLGLTVAYSGAASATTWQNGQVITYDQGAWSNVSAASTLLQNDFATVYASNFGLVTVGLPVIGFTMRFDGPSAVLIYLPAGGLPGALNSNVLDPTITSSGSFGGDVLALQLNVDFSDKGFLPGTSNIPLGNLMLQNFSMLPALNGLTVRQFLADVNTLLGGGTSISDIATLDPITSNINASFDLGIFSAFAQDHLVAPSTAVPEPATLLLLGLALTAPAGVAWRRQRK